MNQKKLEQMYRQCFNMAIFAMILAGGVNIHERNWVGVGGVIFMLGVVLFHRCWFLPIAERIHKQNQIEGKVTTVIFELILEIERMQGGDIFADDMDRDKSIYNEGQIAGMKKSIEMIKKIVEKEGVKADEDESGESL